MWWWGIVGATRIGAKQRQGGWLEQVKVKIATFILTRPATTMAVLQCRLFLLREIRVEGVEKRSRSDKHLQE